MSTGPNGFASFMASPAGRGLRIVAGAAIIAVGVGRMGTTSGVVLIVVGLVPLLAGIFNVCMIAPLIGAPFSGRAALEAKGRS